MVTELPVKPIFSDCCFHKGGMDLGPSLDFQHHIGEYVLGLDSSPVRIRVMYSADPG